MGHWKMSTVWEETTEKSKKAGPFGLTENIQIIGLGPLEIWGKKKTEKERE